jgi:uncharacterized surface protein with fasciclin (FAS1) repeats
MRKANYSKLTLAIILLLALFNWNCSSISSLTTPTNLLGMLGSNPNLSGFSSLLNQVPSVGKLLGKKNPLTVLAPTNDAITALGTDTLKKLTDSNSGLKDLEKLLRKHIIPGKVNPPDIAGGALKDLAGNPVNLGDAKVVGEAITADNGNIIVVDKVLQ